MAGSDNPFRHPPDVQRHLAALLRQVPRGQVTTYGALAAALGSRLASRWIGQQLLRHDHTARCTCHRVVRARGDLGGYRGSDPAEKADRLGREGVAIVGGRVDLQCYGFDRFDSRQPLAHLTQVQEQQMKRHSLKPPRRPIRLVAGVDVSYAEEGQGVAAYCLVDMDSGELMWSTTVRRAVKFPYIPTYLAFRELPILLCLLSKVARRQPQADMILVDGSGILHPRRAGIATMLGIVADVPTIGVTKKSLHGQVNLDAMECGDLRPITDHDELLGFAMLPRATTSRALFVSPGHRVDIRTAADTSQRLLCGHRLPEPIYWADRLSRREAQQKRNG